MVAALGEARFQRLLARSRPFDTAELRRLSPMLILAPHPDDETLGCGGLLALASAYGLEPRVAYLTDGSASHRGSHHWTRERLSHLRKQEALAALNELRVPPSHCLFLDWRDAAPHAPGSLEHGNAVSALRRWSALKPPASVWSSWAGEAHCDHVAAASVADTFRNAFPVRPRGYAFMVWGWTEEALDGMPNSRSLWCPATVGDRVRALACHKSQTTDLITDADVAFRLPMEVSAMTSRPFEIHLELP